MSGKKRRRKLVIGAATVALCGTLMLGMTSRAPLILYPITPSLPPGLYVQTFVPPKVGTIAAFSVPEAAKRYKASIGEDVHDDFLFMKPIVAGPADHVCQSSANRAFVNGIDVANHATSDQVDRRQPPLWQICRSLAGDEFFTLSTYLPNSFDSRHFGPVQRTQILATYRRLMP